MSEFGGLCKHPNNQAHTKTCEVRAMSLPESGEQHYSTIQKRSVITA